MAIIVSLWLLIRTTLVQTWVAGIFIDQLEERLGAEIELGAITVRWPVHVTIKNAVVWDQLGDTLLEIPYARAKFKQINIKRKYFSLGAVVVEEPLVFLREDPAGGVNLSFLLDRLIPDSVVAPSTFDVESIQLVNGRFRYRGFQAVAIPQQFSPLFVSVDSLSTSIKRLHISQEEISGAVDGGKGTDISGLSMRDLQGKFLYRSDTLSGDGVQIKLSDSYLDIPHFQFYTQENAAASMWDRLRVEVALATGSWVGENDLSYFIPEDLGSKKISLSGDMELREGRFFWSAAQVYYPQLASFRGELNAKNFDNLQAIHLDMQVDTLIYNPSDHNSSLLGLLVNTDTINLPIPIDSVGELRFEGSYAGYLDEFVTRGSFHSGLGSMQGEVNAKRLKESQSLEIAGQLTGKLDNSSGWLTDASIFEGMSFSGTVAGTYTSVEKHDFDIQLVVDHALINDYTYNDLSIKGNIIDKQLNGNFLADDENLQMILDVRTDYRGELPAFNFELDLAYANLANLNVNQIDSVETLSLNLFGSFTGDHPDNVEGQVWVVNSSYTNSRGTLPINEISLSIGPELAKRQIMLLSDYVDARIFGDIHLDHLIPQILFSARHFLPLRSNQYTPDPDCLNDFTFNINLKNPRPLSEKLSPQLVFRDNTSFSGFFKDGGNSLEIQSYVPQFLIQNMLFTDLTIRVDANQDSVLLTGDLSRLQFDSYNDMQHITLSANLVPDHADIALNWAGRDSVVTAGSLNPSIHFQPGLGKWPRMTIDVPKSTFIHRDSLWNMDDFRLVLDQSYLRIDSLRLAHHSESLLIDGAISDLPFDTLSVHFNSLNLRHLETFSGADSRVGLGGVVNGEAKIFDLHRKGLFLADMEIADLSINEEVLGTTRIKSYRKSGADEIFMEVTTNRGDLSTLGLTGFFNPNTDRIHFDILLDKLRLNAFSDVLSPILSDMRGIASGSVQVTGSRSDPQINGLIHLQKSGFLVDYLNTRYTFTHPVRITPDGFWVDDLIARDKFGNEAVLNGGVRHNKFKDIRLDLRLDVQQFLILDTNEAQGDGYWGTAFATGVASIAGPLKNMRIDVNATTARGTDFSIPVSQGGKVRKIDFIKYVEKETEGEAEDLIVYDGEQKGGAYKADLSGLELNLDIVATPDARAQIIIDSETGDVIRAYGRGNLNIVVDTKGVFSLTGDYTIDQGNYQFTLQNMPLKRFEIEPGGRVIFNGPISEAQIDVDANYKTNAALYDLILDESNPNLRQRTPVECHLLMLGRLENPSLEFDIVLPPNSNDIARSQLANLSQEEINRQVLSLLILNQFSPLPGISSSNPRSIEGAGITTTTEVLSNQLNYLLSQITNDFDIGFNYLTGNELTSDEVVVALRAQLLENRMTINVNGNVDVRPVDADANQLVGDVEVEYKIVPSGKLRVKAFTRANDRLLYEYSQYTQGVGIFFREEFNTFGELFRKYWDGIFNR